jgi:hypothetical protein
MKLGSDFPPRDPQGATPANENGFRWTLSELGSRRPRSIWQNAARAGNAGPDSEFQKARPRPCWGGAMRPHRSAGAQAVESRIRRETGAIEKSRPNFAAAAPADKPAARVADFPLCAGAAHGMPPQLLSRGTRHGPQKSRIEGAPDGRVGSKKIGGAGMRGNSQAARRGYSSRFSFRLPQ